MAVIIKRGARWRAQVWCNGSRRSRSFAARAAAQAWAQAEEERLAAGLRGGGRTVADLLDRYAREVSALKRGARWEVLRAALIGRSPLGAVRLDALTAPDVAAWRDARLREVSGASVRREMTLLSHACRLAVREWQWLVRSPVPDVARPAGAPPRTRRPQGDELERILHVLGYVEGDPCVAVGARVGAAVVWAVETAMRCGEACALTAADVDVAARTARLARSKTGPGRVVPLSSRALAVWTQCGGQGLGLLPSQVDANWRRACRLAGVTGLHYHDLRREALTRLATRMDALLLAKISGHRDLRILLATYYAPDMAEVARRLG